MPYPCMYYLSEHILFGMITWEIALMWLTIALSKGICCGGYVVSWGV